MQGRIFTAKFLLKIILNIIELSQYIVYYWIQTVCLTVQLQRVRDDRWEQN